MRTAQSNGLPPSPDVSYLVAFPGAYSASDPGINFNTNAAAAMTATTYVVPGPSVWPGSGTSSAASAVTRPQAPGRAYLDDAEYGRRGDERRE